MKYLFSLVAILALLSSCNSTKDKTKQFDDRMKFEVVKIQDEKDGQMIFLKDEMGEKSSTIISPANGNFVELKVGDLIALDIVEVLYSNPPQLISKNIEVLGSDGFDFTYEKREEEIYWIASQKAEGQGAWGQLMDCLQFQKADKLNPEAEWDLICDKIEYFDFQPGYFYKIKVLKKWIENHENLMDRTPYDLELVEVIEKIKDDSFENPIISTISVEKNSFALGESINLTLEVKNNGSESFRFLPWGTPIEKRFTGDCLKVTFNGKKLPYTGIMVKRTPPKDKDYITLTTGESAKGTVDILNGYPIIEKGTYVIQFKERYGGIPASNTIKIEVK